jgi:hypothetical protein
MVDCALRLGFSTGRVHHNPLLGFPPIRLRDVGIGANHSQCIEKVTIDEVIIIGERLFESYVRPPMPPV